MVGGGWWLEFRVHCQYDPQEGKSGYHLSEMCRTFAQFKGLDTVRVAYREAIKLGWKETSTSLWYCPDHAHHA